MRVGDVLQEFAVRPNGEVEPPVLTLTEKNGFIRQAERFNKRLATENTAKYKVVRRFDIAFNPYLLWAGAVAQNTIVDAGIISPLYPTFHVRDGHDPRYIARLLLTPQMIAAYDTIAFGSVPRRRRSSVKDFLNLPLPDQPPLEEQRRIAAILDHADELLALRQRGGKHGEMLTTSIFQDMFGDPDDAVARGDFVLLPDVVAELRGGRNLVADDAQAATRNRVLRISAVTTGIFKPWESKPVPDEYTPPDDHYVRSGDLLMSRANTTDLVGAVALVAEAPHNLLLPDKIWRFVWRDPADVEPLYAWSLFRTRAIRRELSARSSGTGGSMKNISKAKLASLRLPWPSLPRQREFVDRVRAIPAFSGSVESMRELRASLQSRAFSGQL